MKSRAKSQTSGFSLIEVTLAMGIVVFCLVALMGLLIVGLNTNQASVSQSAANAILSEVISDLRSTPGTLAKTVQFNVSIPANPVTAAPAPTVLYFTSDGQYSPTPGAGYVYRLTLTFPPNGTSARTATFADLLLTWPAAALPAKALGSVETFVALDRN